MDEPALDNDDLKYRFRAEKSGNLIKFKGVISDVTTFEHLEDILTNAAVCDLSELHFGSWIGLNNLIHFLKARSMQLHLRNIPAKTFQVLRLLDPQASFLKLAQAELRVLDSNKKETLTLIDLEELKKPLSHKVEFFNFQGLDIVSPLRFHVPDFPRALTPMELSNWNPQLQEELSFWLSYTDFTLETIAVSIDLLEAGLANCLWTLSEMRATVAAAERALLVISPNAVRTLSQQIVESKAAIQKEFQFAISSIVAAEREARARYVFLREAVGKANPYLSEVHVAIDYFLKSIESMEAPGSQLEHHGSVVVDSLIRLAIKPEDMKQLVQLSALSQEHLKKVRDAFSIMDIMSEGDADATADLIREEVNRLEQYIQNSVVNLQVFDLTRQIIDHRVVEARKTITQLQDINQGKINFETLRAELEEQIFRKLVTDQEKRAQEYFLYQAQHVKAETGQDPGDILLF